MPRILFTADFDMEKSNRAVNLIKGLVIVIVAVLIVVGIDKIFLLKSEDGISQMESVYLQKDNTVDVLFLGNSHVYCDIATGVLWDNYGMAAFDLGGAEAPSWVSYYHLKETLKTQKPKLVCFETSVAALFPTLYQSDSWTADNNYGMKAGENRLEQLKVNSEETDFRKRIFPLSIMHGRYTDLCENDFKDVKNTISYKGFDPREGIVPMETPVFSPDTPPVACSEKAEEYTRKIIELCRDNDIPIMIFVSPYIIEDSHQAIYNYIFEIASEYDVPCINFNEMYGEIGLDFGRDMADVSHLNYYGNYKFTDFFGNLIKTYYDIPDRRGDENFASWEEDAANQRMDRNSFKFFFAFEDPDSFIEAFSNDGYDVFITIKTGIDNGLNEASSAAFERIGIPREKQLSGNAFVIKNQEIVAELTSGFRYSISEEENELLFIEEGEGDYYHSVSLFVDDEEHKEDYGNVVYVYDTVNKMFVIAQRL